MPIDRGKVLARLRDKSRRPLLLRELMRVLKLSKSERGALRKVLEEMVEAGEILRIRGNRWGVAEKMNLVPGRFQGHPDGYGFLIPDTAGETDLFIPKRNRSDVMHGDRAVGRVERAGPKGQREGRIVRILERGVPSIVGRYEEGRGHGFVVPTDARYGMDLFISLDATMDARHNDLVVAEVTEYPTDKRGPEGRVVRILGEAYDPRLDTEMVMAEFSLPTAFPSGALAEAAAIPDRIPLPKKGGWGEGRRDLRQLSTVTIDGERAKDFDDAVSIERLSGNRYRLWVHIADVGAYVGWNTPLDLEARLRGTSVYFPDRVVPMFPEKLSNVICSLNPREDRLTVTVEMTFDRSGHRESYSIYESVIQSRERMTYTDVGKILEKDDQVLKKRYGPLVAEFEDMAALCQALRARREDLGSIDFDLPEPAIILDLQGQTTDILKEERNIAHRLIEEFMLQANQAVAEEMTNRNIPTLYRVHDPPDPAKVSALAELASAFGLHVGGTRADLKEGRVRPKQLQQLVAQVRGRPEERLINHVVLRTMKQARYAVENRGHFGLAFTHYAHFTSPIRRYPDLVVHRLVKEWLGQGSLSTARRDQIAELLPEIARHTSSRERVAMEAEREVVDLKKVRFMADKVGEEFPGFITGVTAFGLFIELSDFFVEGLVHIASIPDDYYIFLEKEHALQGRNRRRRFRIGDRVTVRVERVDLNRRRLEFTLAGPADRPAAPSGPAGGKGGRSRPKSRRR